MKLNPFRFLRVRRYGIWANQTDPRTWTVAILMNSRAQPPLAAGTRRASVRLLLWLAPTVAISAPSMAPELPVAAMSRPYLAIVGAPALRFAEKISSPPELSATPPAGAPPQPGIKPDQSTPSNGPGATKADPTIASATKNSPETILAIGETQQSSGNPPVPILPDDVRPKVRPEDFLPFFQFPGAYHEINNVPVPPAPGQIPSSATYRQQ